MAETTKKTTTKKATPKKAVEPTPATNPLLEALAGLNPEQLAHLVALAQGQTPQPATVATEPKPARITKSYLNNIRDREVEVRNIVNGSVTFVSPKTQIKYVWTQKGDIESMTIAEVLAMHGKSKKFLGTPWLVVEDEEVNEGLGLGKANDCVDLLENLEDYLDEPFHVLKQRIELLNEEQKAQLADQVSLKIQNSELRDIVLIRNLQELLNKEFLEIK